MSTWYPFYSFIPGGVQGSNTYPTACQVAFDNGLPASPSNPMPVVGYSTKTITNTTVNDVIYGPDQITLFENEAFKWYAFSDDPDGGGIKKAFLFSTANSGQISVAEFCVNPTPTPTRTPTQTQFTSFPVITISASTPPTVLTPCP